MDIRARDLAVQGLFHLGGDDGILRGGIGSMGSMLGRSSRIGSSGFYRLARRMDRLTTDLPLSILLSCANTGAVSASPTTIAGAIRNLCNFRFDRFHTTSFGMQYLFRFGLSWIMCQSGSSSGPVAASLQPLLDRVSLLASALLDFTD